MYQKKPLVLDPPGNQRHQDIVVDTIEKLLDIDIHDLTLAIGYVRLSFQHGLLDQTV